MSQDLQMTISARDQASKVLEGVEKKVANFGKQFGQQLVGMVAPMAVVGFALGKISQKIEEIRQKRKEAFDWGASLQASANKMGVTVEQFQAIEAAADSTSQSVDKIGESFKLANDLIESAKNGNEDAGRSIAALGFKLEDLDKLKPQDVLRALAGALASVKDPAEKGEIAIAALGKEAKNLQNILEKGFDIAGAFDNLDGLSTEEQRNLRELQKEERIKANRERLIAAREESARRALDSGDMEITGAAIQAGGVFSKGTLAQMPAVQEAIRKIQARRQKEADEKKAKEDADAAAASGAATPEQASANLKKKVVEDAARAKAAEEAKKKAEAEERQKDGEGKKKPKEKKERVDKELEIAGATQPTVSSLRAIGGGIAGEVAKTDEFHRTTIAVQKEIRDILKEINSKGGLENTDFTKPVPNIVPVPTLGRGRGPTMVA